MQNIPSTSTSQVPPSGTLTIPNSTNVSEGATSEKDNQGSLVSHVSNSVLSILSEGFDEIDNMFSKLAARVKMPFHQVSDHYIRLHSHGHGGNLWNTYSMYFMKNTERELAPQLPPDSVAIPFYQDTYVMILETWKEAKELENMGGTVAQRQQLFDKSKKNLNHMVRRHLFARSLM